MRFFFALVLLPACAAVVALASACGGAEATPDARDAADAAAAPVDTGRKKPVGSGTTPSDDLDEDPAKPVQGPASSRPSAVACRHPAPRPSSKAADAGPDASFECTGNADCTSKSDGRCNELRSVVWFGGQSLGTRCTYDACTTDSDCATGVCGCELGFGYQNVCLPQSNCRIDSECSQGSCSFSRPFILNNPGVIVTGNEQGGGGTTGAAREGLGWFCTTPEDECAPGQTKGAGGAACVYGPDRKHWMWGYQP